ncbi:MAG: hypothetical protein QM831_24210 [Kofleriaceae bacterium]
MVALRKAFPTVETCEQLVDAIVRDVDAEVGCADVILRAARQLLLEQVTSALRELRHPLHETYLDACVRNVWNESNDRSDRALDELEQLGIRTEADQGVITMSAFKRLAVAAAIGVPPALAARVAQLAMRLELPVIAQVEGLDMFRRLALEARTFADLRNAGAYLARFVAEFGAGRLAEIAT